MDHLVERGCDEAGEADEVGLVPDRGLKDRLAGNHHAKVDDLVVVTAKHNANDVLADVVHVALHGRDDEGALRGAAPFSMNGVR